MRVHVIVILWIFANGTKLIPMSVIKDISGGRTEKNPKAFFGKISKDLCILPNKNLFQWVHNESLNFRSLQKNTAIKI